MNAVIVQVMCDAVGGKTPHDGRYVVSWNPHTPYGTCSVKSTPDAAKARRFRDAVQAFDEYRRISVVQPRRPDGKPNRPLTGLTIEMIQVDVAESESKDAGAA